MITNIETLKSELFSRKIIYYDYAMKGCSESEILELESKYGKFPLSYREIIKTIGRNAGKLILDGDDTIFYIFSSRGGFTIADINEEFEIERKEALDNNNGSLIRKDLLAIPEYMFIVESWDCNNWYILTDPKENQKDSPVYLYQYDGVVQEKFSSVWKWIEEYVALHPREMM